MADIVTRAFLNSESQTRKCDPRSRDFDCIDDLRMRTSELFLEVISHAPSCHLKTVAAHSFSHGCWFIVMETADGVVVKRAGAGNNSQTGAQTETQPVLVQPANMLDRNLRNIPGKFVRTNKDVCQRRYIATI